MPDTRGAESEEVAWPLCAASSAWLACESSSKEQAERRTAVAVITIIHRKLLHITPPSRPRKTWIERIDEAQESEADDGLTACRQPRYLLVLNRRPEALRPRLATGLPLTRVQLLYMCWRLFNRRQIGDKCPLMSCVRANVRKVTDL